MNTRMKQKNESVNYVFLDIIVNKDIYRYTFVLFHTVGYMLVLFMSIYEIESSW